MPSPPTPKVKRRIGPWTRLASKSIYRNPWIAVREDRVKHPDGSPGIYGVVEFQNLAVGVVALDKRGRVLLVGQFRYPLEEYSWEIVEGGCPFLTGEEPQATAIRELREETGYSAARWDYLGRLMVSNCVSNEIGHLYLARDLKAGKAAPEPSEKLDVKWMNFEKAYALAMEGHLQDSITVAGLSRARHFLEKEKGSRN